MMTIDLLGVFGAGLLTFATPCVLPLVPVYLAALTGASVSELPKTTRGQLLLRGVLFSTGLIFVFSLMGLAASSVGGVMVEYRTYLMTAGGLLILLFGLKFLGVVQIPLFDRVLRGDDQRVQTRFGPLNALVMGALFAAGWSPCVGPILGSVLTYTASNAADPLTGAGYLALYGFGFALPLLITAAFAGVALGLLRRLNPMLPKIERAIGILLVVVAATFLFAPVTSDTALGAHIACPDTAIAPRPVMLELYSETCPICQEMKPVVRDVMAGCHDDEVELRSVDVRAAQNRDLIAEYRVVGVPTYVFFDLEGHETARLVGRQTEDTLSQALSTLVGRECPGVGRIPEPDNPPTAASACEAADTIRADANEPTAASASASATKATGTACKPQ